MARHVHMIWRFSLTRMKRANDSKYAGDMQVISFKLLVWTRYRVLRERTREIVIMRYFWFSKREKCLVLLTYQIITFKVYLGIAINHKSSYLKLPLQMPKQCEIMPLLPKV